MVLERGNGSSSEKKTGVETFVWMESGSSRSRNHRPCWTIRHRKSSAIYDSDPHSLKVHRSHNAWKKELMMTRFANQELPEAVWGDNFLELSYGSTGCNEHLDSKTDAISTNNIDINHNIRISFCALEALRTWALMDMEVEGEERSEKGENSNPIGKNDSNKTVLFNKRTNEVPTIIPHKSGRTPDPWDYTYTTNYSGSVECISNGSFDAKQPDQTTMYAVKVLMSQESSTSTLASTPPKPQTGTTSFATTPGVGGFSTTPTAELRPPMCKCVGGRMICAGVAQTLLTTRPQMKTPIRLPNQGFSGRPLLELPMQTKQQLPPPKPSPKWMPYCSDTDGPFDMEALLNSQKSPPLHYTGNIPFWIQNLDPQSYSFLTVTAVVCRGSSGRSSGNTDDGGFIAVLLRCFVRVNGVRVRLIDTKFVIRRQRSSEGSKGKKSQPPPMVILRERSWKEGSWEEYTAGMKGVTDGKYHFLGTDLEQGRRASKTLPNKFPPIVEKLILDDYDNGYTDHSHSNEKNIHVGYHHGRNGSGDENSESKGMLKTDVREKFTMTNEEWRIPALKGRSVTHCASGSGVLVLVVDDCNLVTLDAVSGEFLWENSLAPFSILSLAVQSHRDKANVIVGDDRGCVHVIEWNGVDETKNEGKPIFSKQSYCFEGGNAGNRKLPANVQRPSNWVEKVIWNFSGCFFAAAAGKKVMVNGEVLEMEGTVYDLKFLPISKKSDSAMCAKGKCDSNRVQQKLAIALYGGLTIVDVATMKIWHRRLTVGSSAVLSFAISPNGHSIGIGCLDKRLRIFEKVEALFSSKGGNIEENENESWDARDWIGMDGGVVSVEFGPDNRRLAALGGSILLIIDRASEWGEAPTICSLGQGHLQRGGRACKFQSFAWKTNDILVASTGQFLHMFDVRASIDTVPKQLYPFASIPVENDFLINETDNEIIEWGESGIRKIDLLK